MSGVSRKKSNLSFAVDPYLLHLALSFIDMGEYLSISNVVQTVLSEFSGKYKIYCQYGKEEDFFNNLHSEDEIPDDKVNEYRKSISPRKTPISVSINPETLIFVHDISSASGRNSSDLISAMMRQHFIEEAKQYGTIAEENELYMTRIHTKDGNMVRIQENELKNFVEKQIEIKFKREN